MHIPEQKFHLHLEQRYDRQKQLARMGSLPKLCTRPPLRQLSTLDLQKDSADFLTKINVFVEDTSVKPKHKYEPTSIHQSNVLMDFASYRQQLMERLHKNTQCEFKFSFEEAVTPSPKQAKFTKQVARSFAEPTVPSFLTSLLQTTFHRTR